MPYTTNRHLTRVRPALFLLALALGCAGSDFELSTQEVVELTSVYVSVNGRGGQVYMVERLTRGFSSGWFRLYGDPHKNMPPHELGAQSLASGVFWLQPGQVSAQVKAALPRTRRVDIPATGTVWVAFVAQLHAKQRYPGIVAFPGTTKPGVFVPLEFLHCTSANILTCIPWHQAIDAGLVWCTNRRRTRIPADECKKFVPRTDWRAIKSTP